MTSSEFKISIKKYIKRIYLKKIFALSYEFMVFRSRLTTMTLQSNASIKELQRKKEKVGLLFLQLIVALFWSLCCYC